MLSERFKRKSDVNLLKTKTKKWWKSTTDLKRIGKQFLCFSTDLNLRSMCASSVTTNSPLLVYSDKNLLFYVKRHKMSQILYLTCWLEPSAFRADIKLILLLSFSEKWNWNPVLPLTNNIPERNSDFGWLTSLRKQIWILWGIN